MEFVRIQFIQQMTDNCLSIETISAIIYMEPPEMVCGPPEKKEWNPIVGRQNTLKFSISECSRESLWLLFHKLSFTLWNFSLHIDCWVNIAADIAIH